MKINIIDIILFEIPVQELQGRGKIDNINLPSLLESMFIGSLVIKANDKAYTIPSVPVLSMLNNIAITLNKMGKGSLAETLEIEPERMDAKLYFNLLENGTILEVTSEEFSAPTEFISFKECILKYLVQLLVLLYDIYPELYLDKNFTDFFLKDVNRQVDALLAS